MVGTPKSQLQRLSRLNLFSRWEVAELPRLLMPGEHVIAVLSGFYTSGTAILCVTSRRLLLVDKKIVRLNYEDMRFEAISDISFSQQAVLASARFYIAGRSIQFRSWYKKELRILVQFVQDRMFEAHGGQRSADQSYVNYDYHLMSRRSKTTQNQTQPLTQALPLPELSEDQQQVKEPVMQLPHHLVQRVARWQRAAHFVGSLPEAEA